MIKARLITIVLLVLAMSALSFGVVSSQESGGVLNIYSSRHYGAMEAPFVAFSEATGVDVRVSAGSPRDLLTRLRADIDRGDRSIADLFLAIDAGVLSLAAEEGLLQPVESDILNTNIAPEFRDPDGYWYGLSVRARTVVYNPENVTDEELENLQTYADLANPIWADRMCMRPAAHIYTVSTLSSVLFEFGEEEAAPIFSGISANVTRYIDSDTRQIEAVAAGECDVALVNHYYMGRLANGNDAERAVFDAVKIQWLNQGDDQSGVFFNVNGAGIVKNASNYDNALLFLEFMSQAENQCGDMTCFPGSNFEYPVNPDAELNPTLVEFGEFELNTDYALSDYGAYQAPTVALLETVDFGFEER